MTRRLPTLVWQRTSVRCSHQRHYLRRKPSPPPKPLPNAAMNARSSSYHAHLSKAAGHTRRASRTSAELTSSFLQTTSTTTYTDQLYDQPAALRLDFSPKTDSYNVPGRPPNSRRNSKDRLQIMQPAVPAVLRPNKSTHRLIADARIAVTSRTKRLDRRILYGGCIMFFPVFFILFFILDRMFGVQAATTYAPVPDAASNAKRISEGLPPQEYWPYRRRTRLRYGVPYTGYVYKEDITAMRNRNLPRQYDYRLQAGSAAVVKGRQEYVTRVSLIAACRDRTGFLQTALPTWRAALSSVDEIVIANWGTSEGHVSPQAVVEAIKDPRISIVNVQNTQSWILSHAYNLALSLARGEWILKVDCDTMLTKNFVEVHTLPPFRPQAQVHSESQRSNVREDPAPPQKADEINFYYRFLWEDAQDENERHLNGVALVRSEDVRSVYGYDERITTYGWEDSDLYERLERKVEKGGAGLVKRRCVPGTASHIKHDDEMRASHQVLSGGPFLETQVNSLALGSLPAWDKVAKIERAKYKLQIASNDGRYVFATPVHLDVPSALKRLTVEQQKVTLSEARDRVLHDMYGIPWKVLLEISRSRAELVRALDRIRRVGAWRDGSGVIFAEVSGSIGQRILGAASAVALAIEHRRPLFLAWKTSGTSSRTVRTSDVFDLEAASESGVYIFQMGVWKCRTSVTECGMNDEVFRRTVEFVSSRNAERAGVPEGDVLNILRAEGNEQKQNVLLRLEGAFPGVERSKLVHALKVVQASPRIRAAVNAHAGLGDMVGVYVGPSMRERGVDAMVSRLQGHGSSFFVSGSDRALVKRARAALHSRHIEADEAPAQVAEIFALAKCSVLVNDGRPPKEVGEVVGLLKEGSSAAGGAPR